jgi:hypothetical protein
MYLPPLAQVCNLYQEMKNINGNVMVLYNFLLDPLTSPYNKPFMFRFGFNLDK